MITGKWSLCQCQGAWRVWRILSTWSRQRKQLILSTNSLLSRRDASPGWQHFLIFHETLSHHEDQHCVEQTLLLRDKFNPTTVCDLCIYLIHTIEMWYFVQCNITARWTWYSYKQAPSKLRTVKNTFQSVLVSTVLWQKNDRHFIG